MNEQFDIWYNSLNEDDVREILHGIWSKRLRLSLTRIAGPTINIKKIQRRFNKGNLRNIAIGPRPGIRVCPHCHKVIL